MWASGGGARSVSTDSDGVTSRGCLRPSRSATRTSSGREPTSSFVMTRARCTFTVFALVAEHRRDLLVEPPARDQRAHLALARGEAGRAPAKHAQLRVHGADRAIARDRALHRGQELVGIDRLGEEVDRAALHRADAARHVFLAADEDRGLLHSGGSQQVMQLETAQPRQVHVEDQASRDGQRLALEQIAGGGERLHGVARRREEPRERAPHGIVVVHQQQDRRLRSGVVGHSNFPRGVTR